MQQYILFGEKLLLVPIYVFRRLLFEFTYFHSSVSVESSCSRYENMTTISVIIRGHNEVTCWGDIRIKITRKHKNTALCTAGELGIVRRLSANLSENVYVREWLRLLSNTMTRGLSLGRTPMIQCMKIP